MTSERCVRLGNSQCNQNTNAFIGLFTSYATSGCVGGTKKFFVLEVDLEDLHFALFGASCGIKSCTFFIFLKEILKEIRRNIRLTLLIPDLGY